MCEYLRVAIGYCIDEVSVMWHLSVLILVSLKVSHLLNSSTHTPTC